MTSGKLPAEERRALTIQTVIDLAARQNPSDITTTDIARHMGLTQGALFRHFPTKDELWLAVMDWVAEHKGRIHRWQPCRRCSWPMPILWWNIPAFPG